MSFTNAIFIFFRTNRCSKNLHKGVFKLKKAQEIKSLFIQSPISMNIPSCIGVTVIDGKSHRVHELKYKKYKCTNTESFDCLLSKEKIITSQICCFVCY